MTKDVDNIKEQRVSRPNENTKFDIEIKEGVENEKKDFILNLY